MLTQIRQFELSHLYVPVDGQNLEALSQEAGKAAYSLEYGFVHASPISKDGGWGAPCINV